MLAVQLGSSSRTAWLLLWAFASTAVVFGLLWVTRGDWVAAGFCVLASIGAGRMGVLLLRRRRLQASADATARGRAHARTLDGALFVSFAHFTRGASVRHGVLVVGPSSAGFIPMGGWTPLWLELLLTPFVARFRFVDLQVGPAGDLDAALHDMVGRHGGTIVDTTWTYARGTRWLVRPGVPGILWIEREPPDAVLARWAPAPAPTPERYQFMRDRIVATAAAILVVFAVGGVLSWRLTGDIDLLIAALFYGVLLCAGLLGGLVMARRRLSSGTARR